MNLNTLSIFTGMLALSLSAAVCAEEPVRTDRPALREQVIPAWQSREVSTGSLIAQVDPIRTVLRGVRTPMATALTRGTILLCAGSSATGAAQIRSEDRGFTWRVQEAAVPHLNTLELTDGRLLVIDYKPIPRTDQPGTYSVKTWISTDRGKTLPEAPTGELRLPADIFDPKLVHWFHGNLVQTPLGDVVTVMQGEEVVEGKSTWRSFFVHSRDAGRNWEYVSMVADHAGLAPIRSQLEKTGWRLHGAVEPNLVCLEDGTFICVARVMDDESNVPESQFGEAGETYHDLSYTVAGDGIYPGVAQLPAQRFYVPGAPSSPLIIMRSTDGGKTWSAPEPMEKARGCFPRMAKGEGIIALSYGGGSGALRWGNFVVFSQDGGKTWSDEVNIGPFLSTGYTSIVSIGPSKFVIFFDCTPPQSWTNVAAHWVGAVDIEVKTKS